MDPRDWKHNWKQRAADDRNQVMKAIRHAIEEGTPREMLERIVCVAHEYGIFRQAGENPRRKRNPESLRQMRLALDRIERLELAGGWRPDEPPATGCNH